MKQGKAFALVLCLFSPSALAGAPTIDRLTCLDAQNFVIRHGRYYKASVDGPLPIYPVMPVNRDPVCKGKERVHYVIERAADLPECLLGFQCVAN